jgi:26S proteasome regulatory subunit T4
VSVLPSLFDRYGVTLATFLGMFAIRAGRGYVVNEDFMKATRKLMESKKLETPASYKKV